mmetsp:Transcript_692/g.2417  ORF Transcript_692/g.2417 Transcript_692/m.2417 type:complete len:412 (-) Transcript_692:18-1253(-)
MALDTVARPVGVVGGRLTHVQRAVGGRADSDDGVPGGEALAPADDRVEAVVPHDDERVARLDVRLVQGVDDAAARGARLRHRLHARRRLDVLAHEVEVGLHRRVRHGVLAEALDQRDGGGGVEDQAKDALVEAHQANALRFDEPPARRRCRRGIEGVGERLGRRGVDRGDVDPGAPHAERQRVRAQQRLLPAGGERDVDRRGACVDVGPRRRHRDVLEAFGRRARKRGAAGDGVADDLGQETEVRVVVGCRGLDASELAPRAVDAHLGEAGDDVGVGGHRGGGEADVVGREAEEVVHLGRQPGVDRLEHRRGADGAGEGSRDVVAHGADCCPSVGARRVGEGVDALLARHGAADERERLLLPVDGQERRLVVTAGARCVAVHDGSGCDASEQAAREHGAERGEAGHGQFPQ